MSWLHSSWEKKVPGLHYSLLMQVCENYLLNNLQHILLLTAAPWCAQLGSWLLLFLFLHALLEARSHLLLRQHSSFQVPASTFLPTPASAAGKGFRKLGRSLLPPGHRLSNKSMCEKQNKTQTFPWVQSQLPFQTFGLGWGISKCETPCFSCNATEKFLVPGSSKAVTCNCLYLHKSPEKHEPQT